MLKFAQDGRNLTFYDFYVKYKDNGVEKTIYTDNVAPTLSLVASAPMRYSLVSHGYWEPDSIYVKRLQKVNMLGLEYPENYYNDLLHYVELGVMTNNSKDLEMLYNDAREDTIRYLVGILAPYLKQCKKDKMSCGVTYKDAKYAADDDTKTNILGYLMLTDDMSTRVAWKDLDGKFQDLSYSDLKEILQLCVKKLAVAFEAEKAALNQLASMSIDALTDFQETRTFSRGGKNILESKNLSIQDVYDYHYDLLKNK